MLGRNRRGAHKCSWRRSQRRQCRSDIEWRQANVWQAAGAASQERSQQEDMDQFFHYETFVLPNIINAQGLITVQCVSDTSERETTERPRTLRVTVEAT